MSTNENKPVNKILQALKVLFLCIVMDIVGQLTFLLLLTHTWFNYFALNIQPDNFRVMLLILLAIHFGTREIIKNINKNSFKQ